MPTDEHNEVTMQKSQSVREVEVREAHEFVELVRNGMEPSAAAERVGVPLGAISKRTRVRARVEELLASYRMSDEASAELVKARMHEILLCGTDKDATAAARVLKGNEQPVVSIQINEEIAALDPGDMWGERAPINVTPTKEEPK